MVIDLSKYDFVDFGCSAGGSIAFGRDCLGGRNGLGVDINPEKVAAARAAGLSAEVADVTKLDPREVGAVRFVIMAHFLEHLPGRNAAQACILSACKVADEFVFIRQPYFDADGYLFSLNLKLYWSDWRGHPNHMTSLDFHNALDPLLKAGKISRYLLFFRTKIENSHDPAVHPISSPINQQKWDSETHDSKPACEFSFPVFVETGAIIIKKSREIDSRVERFLRSCHIAFDSQDGAT
jgi:SAM-dependent methyltransferase